MRIRSLKSKQIHKVAQSCPISNRKQRFEYLLVTHKITQLVHINSKRNVPLANNWMMRIISEIKTVFMRRFPEKHARMMIFEIHISYIIFF